MGLSYTIYILKGVKIYNLKKWLDKKVKEKFTHLIRTENIQSLPFSL